MLDLHHLPGSDLKEQKVLYFRRHPITLLPLILITVFVFFIPPAAYFLTQIFRPGFLDEPGYFTLFVLGGTAFFLFGILFAFQMFVEYWLDVFILTERRILDIDQRGLFSRTVSELRLYRTQDVTAEVKGMLHTILDYGNVYIQTAGEIERFHFEEIPHPNHVAKLILELSEADRKEHLEEAVEDFGMPNPDEAEKEKLARKLDV
ncbi:PH domain-containing protein [Candidatus Uhrbacteria bacterium]|nr:PH domain-containing protein [Candidatus Uhrbacteria bacterium]